MNTIEQVKSSINGLSASDQAEVLMHVLRLKYRHTVEEIRSMIPSPENAPTGEIPDNLSYDELLERLRLLEGIREGLISSSRHDKVSHEDVKKDFRSWRKK